jgi:insertion element IS1 protein InsB
MLVRDACPACGSTRVKKNGQTRHGKPPQQGKTGPRPLVPCLEQSRLSDVTRVLIEHVLVEQIAWRGSCRAGGVGLQWLLGVLVQCLEALPDQLHVEPVSCNPNVLIQRLAVEADAMRRFVPQKATKPWIGRAMDAITRHVMAFSLGNGRRRSAKRLWAKIPYVYRQHLTFYTDQDVVYDGVIPAA